MSCATFTDMTAFEDCLYSLLPQGARSRLCIAAAGDAKGPDNIHHNL